MRFVILCAALALASCANSRESHETTQPASASIYPLAVSLVDEHARPIGLDVERGHPTIIAMFYGSCPVACPLIISHVKEIESRVSPSAKRDMRILLVSFDGAHDTPAALSAIAASRGLDLERWTLATGADDDVRQIAGVLGVTYQALPEGGFTHDSVITVLDREGRVLARTDSPDTDVKPLAAAIDAASAKR